MFVPSSPPMGVTVAELARQRVGLVLGKFMPPHLGHVYLASFARHMVDRLFVVVEHIENESIPSALRVRWMRELMPTAEVLHLSCPHPQQPEDDPNFWDIWRNSLDALLPVAPTHVFASEHYGVRLAAELGAEFVPVDCQREVVPISATAIRANPELHWARLPGCVRAYFQKRVCVFGPESTGKSTLAAQLARHFDTAHVPEYARGYIEAKGRALSPADLLTIARGQLAAEDWVSRQANRLLIADTCVLSTTVWSRLLLDGCDEELLALAAQQRFDLTLLMNVDIPWVQDQTRYFADNRKQAFDQFRKTLDQARRPYVVVSGDWEARWQSAVRSIERLLQEGAITD